MVPFCCYFFFGRWHEYSYALDTLSWQLLDISIYYWSRFLDHHLITQMTWSKKTTSISWIHISTHPKNLSRWQSNRIQLTGRTKEYSKLIVKQVVSSESWLASYEWVEHISLLIGKLEYVGCCYLNSNILIFHLDPDRGGRDPGQDLLLQYGSLYC